MQVLVCIKRVPAPGARIPLTADSQRIDTRHLGFTLSPHDECAVEEAVRIVAAHGGGATALTLGPAAADEQLRTAISMGVDDGVLLQTDEREWDAQATAAAIVDAVRTLADDGASYDLLLFGNESPDAGNHQVGIRVAHALDLPIVAGIKDIAFVDGGVRLRRPSADGVDVHHLPLPAAVSVKEGLNLPRYPSLKGRMRARKASIRTMTPEPAGGGLRTLRLRQPHEQQTDTVVLGHDAGAAPAVVDLFETLGVL